MSGGKVLLQCELTKKSHQKYNVNGKMEFFSKRGLLENLAHIVIIHYMCTWCKFNFVINNISEHFNPLRFSRKKIYMRLQYRLIRLLQVTIVFHIDYRKLTSEGVFTDKGSFGEVYGPCDWKDKRSVLLKSVFLARKISGNASKMIFVSPKLKARSPSMPMWHHTFQIFYHI